MAAHNILLIEPGYKNKYPPLGLMKIAQYHGPQGKNDNVKFIKGEDPSVADKVWDRIYITTLFSFEWTKIAKSIDYASELVNGDHQKIFVGGIAASLMQEKFLDDPRWHGIRFIKGLLSDAPAKSLLLDDFYDDFYAGDMDETPIEDLVPDYSILDQVDYHYPVNDAYFTYASRGCIRKCKFCGVPKLEGGMREMGPLGNVVDGVKELYGEKKDLILMDNNVVASERFDEIINEIIELGFVPGAKIKRGKSSALRRVDFNQGVDARILSQDISVMKKLSKICLKPLRIAFDHIGIMKHYVQAVRYAHDVGIDTLSNYMLYNYHDTVEDLFDRMRVNVSLNEELGTKIYSFPMRYQPTDRPDRGFVGEHWNKYYLRSVQIILQATHGIVSGSPEFFKRAFGDTYQDFENILVKPHRFIFNREWFDFLKGKAESDEFRSCFNKLTPNDKKTLIDILSSNTASKYENIRDKLSASNLKDVVSFYIPLEISEERKIWDELKSMTKEERNHYANVMTQEEIVEDAGLDINIDDIKKVDTGFEDISSKEQVEPKKIIG